MDSNLLAQFPLAEEAVAALGVVVWPMVEFEAVDAIGTAATRFKKNKSVEQIIIGSPDKDLAQFNCIEGLFVAGDAIEAQLKSANRARLLACHLKVFFPLGT